jgi:hypothetical protein
VIKAKQQNLNLCEIVVAREFEFHKQIMKCSITLQIDTTYILDVMFLIINILYHLRMCMLNFGSKTLVFMVYHI